MAKISIARRPLVLEATITLAAKHKIELLPMSTSNQSRRVFLSSTVSAAALAALPRSAAAQTAKPAESGTDDTQGGSPRTPTPPNGSDNRTVPAVHSGSVVVDPSATFNEQIDAARRAALDRLRPSRKQLERAFELHAASLVFDSYGFAPRAAVDGAALTQLLAEGATEDEFDDASEEMPMVRMAHDEAERAEFELAWRASGVTCIFQNAGEEGQDPLRMLKRLARFTYVTDMLSDFIVKAARPQDVVAAHAVGKRCLYFTTNGVPLVQRWDSAAEELAHVPIFFQLGVRMMHLTYNRRNMLGDGCAEPADAGLSDFGRAAIAELNRQGIIVDVAHSGWRTSLEGAKASKAPMVASHTACAAVHHHIRGKPNPVIQAICDTGGLVGIAAIPAFLGGKGDIVALVDHVDYVARTFGLEHVAIGTDTAYQSSLAAAERGKVPSLRKTRTEFRTLWPDDAFTGYERRDPSLAWTNWPCFTLGLVQRGYSDDAIQRILGGNVLRVAREALAARTA